MKKVARGQKQHPDVGELIGICRGVLADGVLMPEEAEFLLRWMQDHRDLSGTWPANALYGRIEAALADGRLSTEEEGLLLDALIAVTRGADDREFDLHPVDVEDSGEPIVFAGQTFCLTGDFVSGARAAAEAAIEAAGGAIAKNPTRTTAYLVVGELGSAEWVGGTFGRKILRAQELRAGGYPIAIVCEARWWAALQAALS